MKSNNSTRGRLVPSLFCTLCLLVLFVSGQAQPASADAVGQRLYQNYCAGCHGASGEGAHGVSGSGPPLTNLARHNGGVFPSGRVVRIIDGREEVRAHGSPMPTWGNKFARTFGYWKEETSKGYGKDEAKDKYGLAQTKDKYGLEQTKKGSGKKEAKKGHWIDETKKEGDAWIKSLADYVGELQR